MVNERNPSEPMEIERVEEIGEQKETIKADLLEKIFQSPQFKKRLLESTNITKKTGHEAGFTVSKKKKEDNVQVLSAREGTTDSCPVERDHIDENDSYRLIELHFHPESYGLVKPSVVGGDLTVFTLENPILIIGQITNEGKINLLLMQRMTKKPLNRFYLEDIKETIADANTQKKILDVLKNAAIRAELVHFDKNKGFSNEDIDK